MCTFSLLPNGGWTHSSSVWGDMHAGLFDWGVLGPFFGRQCPEGSERAACIGMSSSAIAQAQKWCLWHDIRVRFRHVVCDYIACGRCLPFMRCMRPHWVSWGVRAQADRESYIPYNYSYQTSPARSVSAILSVRFVIVTGSGPLF